MPWEKIDVRTLVKPAHHGSGLYLRIPKKLADAYDLHNAEAVIYVIEKVKQKGKAEE